MTASISLNNKLKLGVVPTSFSGACVVADVGHREGEHVGRGAQWSTHTRPSLADDPNWAFFGSTPKIMAVPVRSYPIILTNVDLDTLAGSRSLPTQLVGVVHLECSFSIRECVVPPAVAVRHIGTCW